MDIWSVKSRDLVKAKWASPRLKMLSPGRRTCEMDSPAVSKTYKAVLLPLPNIFLV